MNNENKKVIETPKRWSAKRKSELVLRLFRGEAIDQVSREEAVPIHVLTEWKEDAIVNVEAGFKKSSSDSKDTLLSRAKERIGALSMENELLREKIKKKPSRLRRSPL